jgi:prepilin-type N-terminal cleavage/methylation domain-containing protein
MQENMIDGDVVSFWKGGSRMSGRRGFTLVEGLVALTILGVVLAALFFFIRGTQRAGDTVAREAAISDARLGASRLEDLLANTGYMGDVFPGTWQPVLQSEPDCLLMVANLTLTESFGPEDTLAIRNADGLVTIQNASGEEFVPPFAGSVTFGYFDASGMEVTDPALVRRIDYTVVSDQGARITGSVAPMNLAVCHDPEMLRAVYESYHDEGGSRMEREVFFENFEVPTTFIFEDDMEAGWMWVPMITEDFESPASWSNNWQTWTESGNGRVRRWTSSEAFEGLSCMALDCGTPGLSTQMAVWSVDLSGYDWSDSLRLHLNWREFNDSLDEVDGVYLTAWVPDAQVELLSEDFSAFSNGFPRSWTFWTDDYGRVEISNSWPKLPDGGNYLNLDTRRQGYTGTSRVMTTLDLSAYAGSTDLEMGFDMCSRGSPNTAFVGIMGPGGITSVPLATHQLNPGAYPAGSWARITIDLDELIPVGYDLANTRIVLAQQGTGATVAFNANGGVSFDNVLVSEGTSGYWDMSHKIIAAPDNFPNWTTASVDLSQAAQSAGIPFSGNFLIGFAQMGDQSIPSSGIAFDQISIDNRGWGMSGWTHGPWPGYVTDEWEPQSYAPGYAYNGFWCFAVAGNQNYQQTPTRAWLQSPEIDLTGYPVGHRIAIAFFHRYNFGSTGDGCNVKITRDNGENWELVVPYWGYYTAAVPALGMEPGWTGSNGTIWNFSVIDITAYAGQNVRLRFNYGTVGNSANPGWEVDYTRSRPGADWPQIIWNYTPAKADWFAYTMVNSGTADPTSTPNGSRWAGNDMGNSGIWNLQYEDSQHNALITPPIFYNDDLNDTYAYVEFYASPRFEQNYDFGYVEVARFSEIAPHQFDDWHPVVTLHGEASGWGHYRYRVDNLPPTVFGPNRTVVFRWRMTSDGSIVRGGWNIDRLRFFSSDTWLSNVTHGAINGRYPGRLMPSEGDKPADGPVPPRLPLDESPVVLPVDTPSAVEVNR